MQLYRLYAITLLHHSAKPSWPTGISRRARYGKSRVSYCANSDCTFNLPLNTSRLLKLSGDIQENPGPSVTTQSLLLPVNMNSDLHNSDNFLYRSAYTNETVIKYNPQFLKDLRFVNGNKLDTAVLDTLVLHKLVNRRVFRPRGRRSGRQFQPRQNTRRPTAGRHFDDGVRTRDAVEPAGESGQQVGISQPGLPIPVIVSRRRLPRPPRRLPSSCCRPVECCCC